jgi:hypothetical protein
MFENDPGSLKFLANETVRAKLTNAKKLSTVSAKVNFCCVSVVAQRTESF